MTVLLVRHARAGRRDKWQGDDRLRPLTKRGRIQAEALVELVRPWIGTDPELVSSPWVRCIQTLEPLAHTTSRPIGADETLGEGLGSKAVESFPGWLRSGTVVLCTHGDVIEAVVGWLADHDIDLGRRPRAAKGSVWVLEGAHGVVERAQYLAPV